VTEENEAGRNLEFHDNKTGRNMSRAEFVRKIEDGKYPNFHVRVVHGLKTPASNPDSSEGNNLG
jgi:hypothetical protein